MRKSFSGKELVDHLAYPKLTGKETEKNIFLPNSFGEKELEFEEAQLREEELREEELLHLAH